MKKLTTILVLVAMLLAALGVVASAESYIATENGKCNVAFDVKKADPSVVKKDGIIDVDGGEYVKVDVPVEELSINFRESSGYLFADAMSKTMEYYFSWDETHGFNFAVKYLAKGKVEDVEYDGYFTNIPQGLGSEDPAVPQDMFLSNIGLNFASGIHPEKEGWSVLYHAIGKSFAGEYIEGWYQQRGISGAYDPVGGQDFEVAYPGDGSVIFEWSIPFAEFIDVAPAAGVTFGFTLCATAGPDTAESPNTNCWSVSLGQKGGWLVSYSDDNTYVNATLSDAPVKDAPVVDTTVADTTAPVGDDTTAPVDNTTVATTPAPTKPVTTAIVTEVVTSQVAVTNEIGEVETNDKGEIVTEVVTEVITSIVTEAPTESAGTNNGGAPVTGDPMVIAAVVAAISACGVVVAKKRK